jgi:hypothetical protein
MSKVKKGFLFVCAIIAPVATLCGYCVYLLCNKLQDSYDSRKYK